MLAPLSLLITSITALFSCKVGVVLHSSMLTIIMPLSFLMHYLESSTQNSEAKKALALFNKLGLTGFILVIISAFISAEEDVIMNNYIPILNNLTFIFGLSIFLSSALLSALIAGSNILRFIIALDAASLMISYRKIFYEISYPIDLHGYFEMLFLGPASIMSVVSIFTAYLLFKKMLDAKGSILAEYPALASAIIIIKHHFIGEIDSAKFFSLSSLHIHMINALLVLFIFASLVRYLKTSKMHVIIALFSLLICCFFDFYKADQGSSTEYFKLSYNYGIIISILSFLAYSFNGKNIRKVAFAAIIGYFISSMLVVFEIYADIGVIFANIITISFAIICIINMILERRKLGKK